MKQLIKSIGNTYIACVRAYALFDFLFFKQMVVCGLQNEKYSDIVIDGEWLTCCCPQGYYLEVNLYNEFANNDYKPFKKAA